MGLFGHGDDDDWEDEYVNGDGLTMNSMRGSEERRRKLEIAKERASGFSSGCIGVHSEDEDEINSLVNKLKEE